MKKYLTTTLALRPRGMKKMLLSFAFTLIVAPALAQTIRKGDANDDKKVDREDVSEVSNAIMGKASSRFNEKNADANRDKKVNAADVVVITGMILDGATNSGGQRLVVLKKDGTKLFYDLLEEPVTTFENGQLVISTNKTVVYSPLSEIVRYTFEGAFDEVVVPKANPGETAYQQKNDVMSFSGLPEGTPVELCSSDGSILLSQSTAADRKVEVSLVDQPAGTYSVKIGDASYKFVKL